jgi:predicted ester cyclase
MSTAENLIAFRRYWAAQNTGTVDDADQIVTADFTIGDQRGPEALKSLVSHNHITFPDISWKVEEVVAEGDRIACAWQGGGTQQGEFLGVAPTGKHLTWSGMSIHYFQDGKMRDFRLVWDRLGVLEQVGAAPVPDQ